MTNIEWTHGNGMKGETWNPVVGCSRASAGCDNCYAVRMSHRLEGMGKPQYKGLTVLNNKGDRHFNGTVRTIEDALEKPLRWRKPRMIFVNSMSDLFHKNVPFEFIDKVFAVMALCPQHVFQVLTKRPERMAEYLNWSSGTGMNRDDLVAGVCMGQLYEYANESHWCGETDTDYESRIWPLPNVWIGTSAENQNTLRERASNFGQIQAAVHFLSLEPLLGPVDLFSHPHPLEIARTSTGGTTKSGWKPWIDWVIVGGESGPNARVCDVTWIRSVVKQCKEANVPVFVKQLGAVPRGEFAPNTTGSDGVWSLQDMKGGDPSEWPEDLRVRQWPEVAATA